MDKRPCLPFRGGGTAKAVTERGPYYIIPKELPHENSPNRIPSHAF